MTPDEKVLASLSRVRPDLIVPIRDLVLTCNYSDRQILEFFLVGGCSGEILGYVQQSLDAIRVEAVLAKL